MTQFGIEEVVGIKSSLEFFIPLRSSLCSCEGRQRLMKMWTSETHLCRHKRIDVIHSPWSWARWRHSQVQHRCLGRKLTFSKCLVKAWDSRQSSGGSLGNLVGACVIATQNCPWQAKWPWAILIPSSLIFFFFLSCEVCGDILILWIRKQSRWNHWLQTAKEAHCHVWAGGRCPQGLFLCVSFPRSSRLSVPKQPNQRFWSSWVLYPWWKYSHWGFSGYEKRL